MNRKEPRVTSAVLIVHDGKYLLAKRNKENYHGYWVIPGGGVDFGETIEEAAIREIKEETDLDIELTDKIGYKEVINVPGNYHSIVFFHLAKPKNIAQVHNIVAKEDISSAEFFSPEKIKELKIAESVEWALKEAKIWR